MEVKENGKSEKADIYFKYTTLQVFIEKNAV